MWTSRTTQHPQHLLGPLGACYSRTPAISTHKPFFFWHRPARRPPPHGSSPLGSPPPGLTPLTARFRHMRLWLRLRVNPSMPRSMFLLFTSVVPLHRPGRRPPRHGSSPLGPPPPGLTPLTARFRHMRLWLRPRVNQSMPRSMFLLFSSVVPLHRPARRPLPHGSSLLGTPPPSSSLPKPESHMTKLQTASPSEAPLRILILLSIPLGDSRSRCAIHRVNPTCIYTHTCMHAYAHTYIHAYLHTHVHTYIHTHTHIHTYMHALTRPAGDSNTTFNTAGGFPPQVRYTYIHTHRIRILLSILRGASRSRCAYTHTHTHTHTHVHAMHTYIRTYIHTYVRTYIDAYTHTCIHTCIHACIVH